MRGVLNISKYSRSRKLCTSNFVTILKTPADFSARRIINSTWAQAKLFFNAARAPLTDRVIPSQDGAGWRRNRRRRAQSFASTGVYGGGLTQDIKRAAAGATAAASSSSAATVQAKSSKYGSTGSVKKVTLVPVTL